MKTTLLFTLALSLSATCQAAIIPSDPGHILIRSAYQIHYGPVGGPYTTEQVSLLQDGPDHVWGSIDTDTNTMTTNSLASYVLPGDNDSLQFDFGGVTYTWDVTASSQEYAITGETGTYHIRSGLWLHADDFQAKALLTIDTAEPGFAPNASYTLIGESLNKSDDFNPVAFSPPPMRIAWVYGEGNPEDVTGWNFNVEYNLTRDIDIGVFNVPGGHIIIGSAVEVPEPSNWLLGLLAAVSGIVIRR